VAAPVRDASPQIMVGIMEASTAPYMPEEKVVKQVPVMEVHRVATVSAGT
jgi:alpha-acetolactate decarboxylase